MHACSNQYRTQYTQNFNDTPLSSNVISSSRQVLYGANNGYAFTPYHLQAPHTTPAQTGHQTPSMPIPMHPISTPPHPDLIQFMHEVRIKLQKLDILENIFSRLVDMEEHCNKLDSEICGIKTDLKDHNLILCHWTRVLMNPQHQQGPQQSPTDHGPQQPPSDQHPPMSVPVNNNRTMPKNPIESIPPQNTTGQ
ncbi:Hypothetical predicted protein [Mytilus galloprovincialis]|uniref:Uncharacterized protein n=1 Tax=Mytilus galloprovincialis TaxID=29158 RepID=A0A8B6C7J7_MYTGA|nr:Hypothetical predicted protein [Mytilus galloprovincialis]